MLRVRMPVRTLSLVATAFSLSSCLHPQPDPPKRMTRPASTIYEQLQDKRWQRRMAAVHKLGTSGRSDALKLLKIALGDPHRQVRKQALRSLSRLGTSEAAEVMVDCLDGASFGLRPLVADSLATMPPKALTRVPTAINVIVAELDPKDPVRLQRLATALAALDDVGLKALLRAVAQGESTDKHAVDKNCALGPCRALASLGTRAISRLLKVAKRGIRPYSFSFLKLNVLPAVLGQMGKLAVPQLLRLLRQEQGYSGMATLALASVGAAAVRPLLDILTDQTNDLLLRRRALYAIRKNRHRQSAYERLLKALSLSETRLVSAAAKALAVAWPKRSFSALSQLLRQGPKAVRNAIVDGSRYTAAPGADALLLQGLKQSDPDVKVMAVEALAARKSQTAVPSLVAALNGAKSVLRIALVKALGRIADRRATQPLLALLRHRAARNHRKQILRALGLLRDPRSYKALARFAGRGKRALRLAAIAALGKLATSRAKKLLKRLEKTRDQIVARAVRSALRTSAAGAGVKNSD